MGTKITNQLKDMPPSTPFLMFYLCVVTVDFLTFKEPKNRFQGTNSARLCGLADRYDKPIPTRFLDPLDCLKIRAGAPAHSIVLERWWNERLMRCCLPDLGSESESVRVLQDIHVRMAVTVFYNKLMNM
jgi:hypothetical protein